MQLKTFAGKGKLHTSKAKVRMQEQSDMQKKRSSDLPEKNWIKSAVVN